MPPFSSAFLYLARRSLPAAAAWVVTSHSHSSNCEAPPPPPSARSPPESGTTAPGFQSDAKGDFHGLFPKRQLWKPLREYPWWDVNWDGHHPSSTDDPDADRQELKRIRQQGITRHIILVRHGQYAEDAADDDHRILTPLGREQASYTGKRLRELIDGVNRDFGPCRITKLHVSNMARAKETAALIAQELIGVTRSEPDPDLNEGRPCHNVPGGTAGKGTILKTQENHPRIERAFRKYFYRAEFPNETEANDDNNSDDNDDDDPSSKHEFEVIVCHANVIRYFFCRALQLPPEAWLRLCTFNCSMTYLTIRPTGTVSCRSLGDVGHIPYGKTTFSMHTGYNW